MTISHRATCSSSNSARQNTTSSQYEPADDPSGDDEIEEGYLRGSADLPPIISNEQGLPPIISSEQDRPTTTKQAFVPGHLTRQPLGPGQ